MPCLSFIQLTSTPAPQRINFRRERTPSLVSSLPDLSSITNTFRFQEEHEPLFKSARPEFQSVRMPSSDRNGVSIGRCIFRILPLILHYHVGAWLKRRRSLNMSHRVTPPVEILSFINADVEQQQMTPTTKWVIMVHRAGNRLSR